MDNLQLANLPAESPNRTNTTTKAELFSRAKVAIEDGDQSMREAAEALALAKEEHSATQREMAVAVGKSASWVNALLKWRRSGYNADSPFGPTSKASRVQHAEQRAKASKPGKPPKPKTTSTTAEASPSADAETSTSSTATEISNSRKPTPAEAKGNLLSAIKQWWPLMDDPGRAEVIAFFFEQKGMRVSRASDK